MYYIIPRVIKRLRLIRSVSTHYSASLKGQIKYSLSIFCSLQLITCFFVKSHPFLHFREIIKQTSALEIQRLTMRCLVCCCWRQINGTYVKQLKGFLQFGGSLTYWKTMATYNVRAPPSGCKQNITGQVLKIPTKYHQQKPSQHCHQDLHKIHLQQTFWRVRLN